MSGGPARTDDASWLLLLISFLVACALWFVWTFFKFQILEVLRWVRMVELAPVALIDHSLIPCVHWLYNARGLDPHPSQDMVSWTNACFGVSYLRQVPPEDLPMYYRLSSVGLAAIERGIMSYLHWVIAAIFFGFAYHLFFVSFRGKFRTRYTLETFIKMQAQMWPVISPIVDFNPTKSSARILGGLVPDKLPLFAEALSPEEWIAWHRIPVTNNIPDREASRRAFIQQLGPRWTGNIESAPIHIQGLFAAFALKGAQKRDESDDFLGQLSLCWSEKGGLRLTSELKSEIRKIIRDPALGGKALEIARPHAYRTTALLAVLRWSRLMGGVLAPAQFLWLRGTDRALWYPLNNLGRRSFHSEGAGAMSHYMAEVNAKKALPLPRVDTAVITLNQYMATSGRPVPPREGDDVKSKN